MQPGVVTATMRRLVVLVLLAGLAACTTPRTVPMGGTVAQAGITAADGALAAYATLDGLAAVEAQRARLGNILTLPAAIDPWDPALAPSGERRFGPALEVRQEAFGALRAVFVEFNRLADPAFGERSEAAARALTTALAGFSAAAGTPLPEQAATRLPAAAGVVTEQLQAGAIQRHNRHLQELAGNALALWVADLPYWRAYVDTVFDSLVDQMRSLPQDRFDMAQVARAVPEPFADFIRLRLYKERFAAEAEAEKNAVLAELGRVTASLTALELATTELAKDQPSLGDVDHWVGRIRALGD